jgi:hypothetical protein
MNSRLKEVYIPSSVMAVDESMVQFNGRFSMKQYMPMKPVKRGYKVWCLALELDLLANLIYIQGEETGSGTLHFLLLRGRC